MLRILSRVTVVMMQVTDSVARNSSWGFKYNPVNQEQPSQCIHIMFITNWH